MSSNAKKQLRINLFAGPGSGKSLLAGEAFGKLKRYGCSIELVQEYIKQWAYEGKVVQGFDQLYIFAKQLRSEERLLRAGIEVIITDSPLYLQAFYSQKYNGVAETEIITLAQKFEQAYPLSLNLWVKRHNEQYQQHGRYETYEEALQVDINMRKFLNDLDVKLYDVECDPQEVAVLALHKLKEV